MTTIVSNQPELASQLNAWGVTTEEIKPEIMQYADIIIQSPDTRIGDIVVKFGFATKEIVEHHARTKPANVLMLDHLNDKIDNLRPHSQKLLAANDKLAYYETLTHAPIHPNFHGGSHQNATLRAFCQEHSCLPLTCNVSGAIRLVFADYVVQKRYAQSSRIQRAGDPITQLLIGEQFIIYAIATREQIISRLYGDAHEAVEATDDEDRVNVWTDTNADTNVQKLLARILNEAVQKKASNVKFTPSHDGTVKVYYRRHGNMRRSDIVRGAISPQDAAELARFLHTKSVARFTDTSARVQGRLLSPADGQFVFQTSTSETFMRCSYIPAANDGISHMLESISIRLMPRDAVSIKLETINISPAVIVTLRNQLSQDHGLILVVGPTSSGKSTTIAGAVSLYLDMYGDTRNLLSLEQPVERHLNDITQINVHQSKFEAFMAAILRHDPDFIWVGEIRDRPSASTCVRAANTGHIVLSTLHADDTTSAFNALLSYINNNTGSGSGSVIVTQYDAISALSLIIAQRLIPTLCSCRLPITSNDKQYTNLVAEYTDYCERHGHIPRDLANTYIRNPEGCAKCEKEGYDGEVPINEVLPVSRKLRRELIKLANSGQNDAEILAKERSFVLYDEAIELVLAGKVQIRDALKT